MSHTARANSPVKYMLSCGSRIVYRAACTQKAVRRAFECDDKGRYYTADSGTNRLLRRMTESKEA